MGRLLLLAVIASSLAACVTKEEPALLETAPVASGASLYAADCSACHGAKGQGAVNIAPPLAGNTNVTGNARNVIRAVRDGLLGPVREHGQVWSGSMPDWRGTLSNAQIAAVVTYIRSSWGNRASPVRPAQVAALAMAPPRQPPHTASNTQPALVSAVPNGGPLYATNCSGCHGATGQGATNIAPPLAGNSFVMGNASNVIRTVEEGLLGPVRERGQVWNGSMPGWRGTLSSDQIAAVINYIRSSWGNTAPPVSAKDVYKLVK